MWGDDGSDSIGYETMLRVVRGRVPEDAIDWEAFHTRLSARAELSLARLRHPRLVVARVVTRVHELPRRVETPRPSARWQHTARGSRVVIPGALAASIALLAAIRTMPKEAGLTNEPNVVAPTTLDGDRSRAAFDSVTAIRQAARDTASCLLNRSNGFARVTPTDHLHAFSPINGKTPCELSFAQSAFSHVRQQ